MKRTFISLMLISALSCNICAQETTETEKKVELSTHTPTHERPQRDIFLVPMVTIDGHLLRFYNQFDSDITIEIAQKGGDNENSVIVYSALKSPEESQHELPAWLTGEYLIYITIDNNLYYGEITVE